MKKVVKIVLVVKEEEPKQLQQKLLLEMQKSTMSYGTVSWHIQGKTDRRGAVLFTLKVLKECFISSSKVFQYNLQKMK